MQKDVDKLRYILKQFTPISEEYGKNTVLSGIDESLESIGKNTSVLFCGEFKRGKSSLINALLHENLCPTDIGIATAVVTRIMYGTTKKAVRYYGDMLKAKENLKKEEIAWEDIGKYTVGDILDIDYTVQMDLYYPSEFLKDGIIIVDTPGIGGLDPRHGTLTKSALQSADVAVFITDASDPVTQSEVDFYHEYVSSNCPNNVVLVNKADILVSDELQTHIDTTKRELAAGAKVRVLPVSAMNWMLINQFGTSGNDDSHRVEVTRAITDCVNAFRRDRLIKLRDALVIEIDSVTQYLDEKKNLLHADAEKRDKAMAGYQKQMAKLAEFRNELSNPTSPLRLKVNTIFEDTRDEVLNLLSHESTVLTTTTFNSLLDSEKGLSDDGKWLVAQINDKIQDLSRKINSKTRDAFFKSSKALEKNLPGVVSTSFSGVSGNLTPYNPINSQLAFSAAGRLVQSGLIAALPTAIVNFLIPGLGTVVGFAIAGALVWKKLKDEDKERRKLLIRQQVLPNINIVLTDLRNQTTIQFTKFHQGLLGTLQIMIKEAEDKQKSLLDSLAKSKISQKELADMISSIEQQKKYLTTLSAQCKLLYTNPFVKNG